MKPLIGLPADRKWLAPHHFHAVGEKYLLAAAEGAGGLPVMVPALPELDLVALLARLDGLFVTGGYSNIEPHHYGQVSSEDDCSRDPDRDATNLRLLPLAIERGLPVLGVCRGLQELNVALGGSLHQKVHEQPGKFDHREDKTATLAEQYGPAHPVAIQPGGVLAGFTTHPQVVVNSVHGQGIDRLAPGLRVEAVAEDGLIEAVSLPAAKGFVLALQWHPEWLWQENPLSRSILAAFGAACRRYAAAKR